MTDFFDEAFGGFDQHGDPNAAIKFALAVIASRHQFARLEPMLARRMPLLGVAGEPGWELERRNSHPPDPTAYADWPAGAEFRVYVDPDQYELAHPEAFYDARAFAGYVWVALAVYGRRHPEEMGLVTRLLDLLPKRPAAAAADAE